MGTPQRERMYPSMDEIHALGEETTTASEDSSLDSGGSDDDRVYVAVGKDVKESKINIMWVVKNFHGKRVCLLHVLQPSQLIPFSKFFFFWFLVVLLLMLVMMKFPFVLVVLDFVGLSGFFFLCIIAFSHGE